MSALVGVDREVIMRGALCVAGMLLLLSPVAVPVATVPVAVWHQGNECTSPTAAVLAPGDVALCVLTVIHCNTDIGMSGVSGLFLCRRWLCRRRG